MFERRAAHADGLLLFGQPSAQEGGFVQLIAAGYGEYVFHNPVADSQRRWRIKQTPTIVDKAKA